MILDISEKSKNINMTPLSFLCYVAIITQYTEEDNIQKLNQ